MTDYNTAHYFRGADLISKYFYDDLGEQIRLRHPDLIGEHISEQIKALGLSAQFDNGRTPFQLPYSFSPYSDWK